MRREYRMSNKERRNRKGWKGNEPVLCSFCGDLRPRDCLKTAKQWQAIAWGKQCSSRRAFRSPRTVKRNRKSPGGDLAATPPNRRREGLSNACRFLGFHQPR